MTDARPIVTDARGASRPHWLLFFGLAATVFVVDQLAKAWIVTNFRGDVPVDLVGPYLRITITQNTGALFGLFRDQAVIFALFSVGVIGLIVWYHGHSARNLLISIALGLLLGGALGNLTDRLRLGYVVDFMDMGIGTWRFYTYNVADAAITTAILLLIVVASWPGLAGRASDA